MQLKHIHLVKKIQLGAVINWSGVKGIMTKNLIKK